MSVYDTFRAAVLARSPVRCAYKGHSRDVCPHTLGWKNGREKVLTYQFAGGSSSGLPPGGEWRCMFIEDVESAQMIEGDWHTDGRHSRPQTCVDDVDVESE